MVPIEDCSEYKGNIPLGVLTGLEIRKVPKASVEKASWTLAATAASFDSRVLTGGRPLVTRLTSFKCKKRSPNFA